MKVKAKTVNHKIDDVEYTFSRMKWAARNRMAGTIDRFGKKMASGTPEEAEEAEHEMNMFLAKAVAKYIEPKPDIAEMDAVAGEQLVRIHLGYNQFPNFNVWYEDFLEKRKKEEEEKQKAEEKKKREE